MKVTLVLLLAFAGTVAPGQTSSTTPSTTIKGTCNIGSVGNNNRVVIHCGVGQEQAKRLVEMLNKILAAQDQAAVMKKLDEILAAESSPTQAQTCVGSNCFQGINSGTVQQNQYGPPKFLMSDAQESAIKDAMKPFAGISVSVLCHEGTQDSIAFSQKLADALRAAGLIVEGPVQGLFPHGPSSISARISANRVSALDSLASAMKSSGILSEPITYDMDARRDIFAIVVTPNH